MCHKCAVPKMPRSPCGPSNDTEPEPIVAAWCSTKGVNGQHPHVQHRTGHHEHQHCAKWKKHNRFFNMTLEVWHFWRFPAQKPAISEKLFPSRVVLWQNAGSRFLPWNVRHGTPASTPHWIPRAIPVKYWSAQSICGAGILLEANSCHNTFSWQYLLPALRWKDVKSVF